MDSVSKQAGLLAIGFGIGVFLTIALLTWSTTSIVLRVSLIALSVSALFVGVFSFGKNYQPNSKKDCTTNKNLRVLIPNYPNKCASYHQTYTKPFHIVYPFLRRIISHFKKVVNHNRGEPG